MQSHIQGNIHNILMSRHNLWQCTRGDNCFINCLYRPHLYYHTCILRIICKTAVSLLHYQYSIKSLCYTSSVNDVIWKRKICWLIACSSITQPSKQNWILQRKSGHDSLNDGLLRWKFDPNIELYWLLVSTFCGIDFLWKIIDIFIKSRVVGLT